MNYDTEQISLLQFVMLYEDYINDYVTGCAKRAYEKGFILSISADGIPSGFLCAQDEGSCIYIEYVFTIPSHRNKGICTSLIKSALSETDGPVRLSVSSKCPDGALIKHIVLGLGFYSKQHLRISVCTDKSSTVWNRFMEEKGNALCDFLKRQGITTASFDNAGPEVLEQVYNSCINEYKNVIDPRPFFDIRSRNLLYDMSYLAVKDGKVIAYTLVTKADSRSVVFEQISASSSYIGSGAVLLPFASAIGSFYDSGMRYALYAMADDNIRAEKFRNKILYQLEESVSTSESFYRERN